MSETIIHIPKARQGQTGMGQGGWTAYQFTHAIAQPSLTVAMRSPIPLETELEVKAAGDERWVLVDPKQPDVVIQEASLWNRDYAMTEPVSIADAERARDGFPMAPEDHPAPHCVSCGLGEHSLRAHAGPLGDGRWATPFRAPDWSLVDGKVDDGLLWMAMDCSCGWYTSMEGPEHQRGVTVQFAVDIYKQLEPDTDYALVAWNGNHAAHWEGRKRGAAAALFDASGACVAQSASFWVSTP